DTGAASRTGPSQGLGSARCAQDGRKRRRDDERAVLEKDCPVGRLSGTQKRWATRVENALARMVPSARSLGRGSARNSTLTRRLKLWVQVRATTRVAPTCCACCARNVGATLVALIPTNGER